MYMHDLKLDKLCYIETSTNPDPKWVSARSRTDKADVQWRWHPKCSSWTTSNVASGCSNFRAPTLKTAAAASKTFLSIQSIQSAQPFSRQFCPVVVFSAIGWRQPKMRYSCVGKKTHSAFQHVSTTMTWPPGCQTHVQWAVNQADGQKLN